MKRFLHYSIKIGGICIAIVIVLYVMAYAYISFNKKKIIATVTGQIHEKLNGTIAIGDVDISFFSNFPEIAVLLKDVTIRDSLYHLHGHTFFQAKKFFADISVLQLIQQKDPLDGIHIADASMFVYTDSSGYTNAYLFTPRKKITDTTQQPKKSGNAIEKIELDNFRFISQNLKKGKLYDIAVQSIEASIHSNDSLVLMSMDTKAFVHSLAFNTSKGSYIEKSELTGDLHLKYHKLQQALYCNDVPLRISNHLFTLSGGFSLTGNRPYRLEVKTNNINYNLARKLLTQKIATALDIVKVEKPLNAHATIVGIMAPGEPFVQVKWTTKNNNIQTPFFNLQQASFSGRYVNELKKTGIRTDANAAIFVHDLTGTWEGIKVKSKQARIENLIHPVVDCDLRSHFPLARLNQLLQSNSFSLNSGNGSLAIRYRGPMAGNTHHNTSINGSFIFNGGNIMYKPRSMPMENCSGVIRFKNSDVLVNDLQCTVQQNHLTMNGSAKNLLSLLHTDLEKTILDWRVFAPELQLEAFAPLLRKRKRVVVNVPSQGKLKNLAQTIDKILNQASIKLDVRTNKLVYKKFEAGNVHAAIDMVEEDWHLKDVSLQHAGGTVKLSGDLKEKNNRYYDAAVNIDMKNVDVQRVFQSFNNFEQDGITSNNIRGKLSTTIALQMNLDRHLSTNPGNMQGYIDFSLKQGSLLNFEPMQKLQNFLFKNRDFDEVHFAELKNRLEVKDNEIHISRMEIQSTALSLFVSGVYGLAGNTDLSIQVPLSNLKKRGPEYKPENIGPDAKAGPSIFVRGKTGDDGNIEFRLDVFNKIRKRLKRSTR